MNLDDNILDFVTFQVDSSCFECGKFILQNNNVFGLVSCDHPHCYDCATRKLEKATYQNTLPTCNQCLEAFWFVIPSFSLI